MNTLVECPICEGAGSLSNGATDPQLQDDGDCHACRGGGSVTRSHHEQLLDGMTDERAERAAARLAADDAAAEREYAQLGAERDREWWS
jgi:hypothetical protein